MEIRKRSPLHPRVHAGQADGLDPEDAAADPQREAILREGESAYRTIVGRIDLSSEVAVGAEKTMGQLLVRCNHPDRAERILAECLERMRRQGDRLRPHLLQNIACDLAEAIALQPGRWSDSVAVLARAQSWVESDGLGPESNGRWATTCRLLQYLEAWQAEEPEAPLAARIDAQREVLERLRLERAALPEPVDSSCDMSS